MPVEFDLVEVRRPVATFVAVTGAAGTMAPCGSVMMPVIEPRFDWASPALAPSASSIRLKDTTLRQSAKLLIALLIVPPLMVWPPGRGLDDQLSTGSELISRLFLI